MPQFNPGDKVKRLVFYCFGEWKDKGDTPFTVIEWGQGSYEPYVKLEEIPGKWGASKFMLADSAEEEVFVPEVGMKLCRTALCTSTAQSMGMEFAHIYTVIKVSKSSIWKWLLTFEECEGVWGWQSKDMSPNFTLMEDGYIPPKPPRYVVYNKQI